MGIHKIGPIVIGLLSVVAVAAPGCGGSGDTQGSSQSTSGTTSSSGMSTSSASSGAGGGGGAGGAGGADGGTANHGAPATETVTAGEVGKSAHFKMVFTLGQPTQNQGKTTSPGYRLQGGLVGANGSLP